MLANSVSNAINSQDNSQQFLDQKQCVNNSQNSDLFGWGDDGSMENWLLAVNAGLPGEQNIPVGSLGGADLFG